MRLINARTLEIVEFLSEGQIPSFVILSHTWEDEECTLQQMRTPDHTEIYRRKGYKKIQSCCKQALKDGFEWAWIDTCCIDKTSTAELSEAINSMFRWYRKARACYAFLADLHEITQLASSRWFTRGWTLQELVAPSTVWFYDSNWEFLGSKEDLRKELEEITGIDIDVLANGSIGSISIARRMSWAAKRQTTRIEDQAYSLLGIFDVNMPLLYGEGKKAFRRLQEEIMKISDDQSLFAWGLPDKCKTAQQLVATSAPFNSAEMHGIFADSPADFTYTDRIHVLGDLNPALPPLVTNNGVRIELQIFTEPQSQLQFAVICCTLKDWFRHYLAFPIIRWNSTWYTRCGELVLIAVTDLVPPSSRTPFGLTSVIRIKSPEAPITEPVVLNIILLVNVADIYGHPYQLIDVYCSAHATYDVIRKEISFTQDKDGLHAAFVYDSATIDPLLLFPSIGFDRRLRAKAGSKLHIIRQGDTTLVSGYDELSLDFFKYFYRPFAVLVGGTIKDPWVKTMLILNDDNPDSDFHRMHATSEEFVRSCITKKQLVSLIQKEKPDNPLSQHQTYHDSHPVLYWEWNDGPTRDARSATKRLHVHANVEMVSANLVEHSRALFVELKDTEVVTETKRPTWWGSNSKG
ncbi:hypothetical protein HBH64_013200 [Parastagonospora nodorum]|nr:hypothetical protein HBH51_008670 [Parastagonospora nodorum]KAH4298719.1 hypothetical protein HBI01_122300 [Parastagonospora nodorum]KAH4313460.1 hypothetical protein HBI02_075770 [Parastagonospora nodorum]KAH4336213.1 hypothetical protein HBI00_029200 [Parastagonospora nodorum]KAH4384671.1 hypothetical protein HBH94_056100 [Parastagonospora nodorum]